MYTCNITIKIKDYNPKIENIPYQNYTCVFTCEDVEFQMPLIAQESDIFQHQMKNITTDLKYKIHILDHNDMTLIGMCDLLISYDILSQLSPPNGFVQEQRKKLFMDPKTKRKLFGSVMNAGDIYLDLYSEIYLCKKTNITKKKEIKKLKIQKNLRKVDGSPNALKKKQFMMDINSDRQAILNKINNTAFTRNNNVLEKGKTKKIINMHTDDAINKGNNNIINNFQSNNSINCKENNFINKPKKNNNINKNVGLPKKNTKPNLSSKKKIENNENNKINNILINEFNSNPTNYNNIENKSNDEINPVKKNKHIIPMPKKEKKTKVHNLPNTNINSSELQNNIIQFNSNPLINGRKITTIECLENIEHSGKKYITKKINEQFPESLHLKNCNNTSNNNYNSVFTTNSTDQNFNEMDKIILEKGTEIRNSFQSQITEEENNNFNGLINENINQEIVKNNIIKLIDFYSLLNEKLIKVGKKKNELINKSTIYKEKLFGELKKNNVLTQKKAKAEIINFLHINKHGNLNENFLRIMIKAKRSEFKIYQNIFNLSYFEYDIMKLKESEQNKLYNNQEKINILIILFRNLLKTYGNISQIYISNNKKKQNLKNVLEKYNITEKNEGEENIVQLKEGEKNTTQNEKFRVIKEEDEDEFEEDDNNHILKSRQKNSIGNSNEKQSSNIIGLNQHKKINYREIFSQNNNENKNEIQENKKLNNNIIPENNNESLENKNEEADYKIENVENENIENNDKKENEINNMNNNFNVENIEEKKINLDDNKNYINNDNFDNDNININENKIKNEKLNKDEEMEDYQKRPNRNRKNKIVDIEENQNNEEKNEQIQNISNEKINSEEKNKKNEESENEKDEEDLIMQKLLIEEFPKKCLEENQFVRLSKYVYSFGDEKINVMYSDGEVILKLDEGDYTLDEFIEILNEGKENEQREKEKENNNEEENVEEENNEEENIEKENIEQNNMEENNEEENIEPEKNNEEKNVETEKNNEENNNQKENNEEENIEEENNNKQKKELKEIEYDEEEKKIIQKKHIPKNKNKKIEEEPPQEKIEEKDEKIEEKIEEEKEEKNLITPLKNNEASSNKDGTSESAKETMTWRKRRRHKISDESSENKEINEFKNQEKEKPPKEYKISSSNKKYRFSNRKQNEEENKEENKKLNEEENKKSIKEENKEENNEEEKSSNKKEEKKENEEKKEENEENNTINSTSGSRYKIRRRRDYMNSRK